MITKKILVAILTIVFLMFLIPYKVEAAVKDTQRFKITYTITDTYFKITKAEPKDKLTSDFKWGGTSAAWEAGSNHSLTIKNNSAWNGQNGTFVFRIGYKLYSDEKKTSSENKLYSYTISKTDTADPKITCSVSSNKEKFTITADDDTSGIESLIINKDRLVNLPVIMGGKPNTLKKDYTISDKIYTITATDFAGNKATKKINPTSLITSTTTTTSDKTPPTLTIVYRKQDGTVLKEGEFTNQNVTVEITANENIKAVSGWNLNNNRVLTRSYTENKQESISVADSKDNKRSATIKITNIDKSAPQITGVTNGGKYTAKINPKATDTNLDKVTLKKDDVEQTTWQNGQEITEQGTYEITATDKAGNRTVYKFSISAPKEEIKEIKINPEEYKAYEIIKIIAYVQPEETVENFIKKLNVQPEEAKVVVLDSEGNEVSKEAKVKTGMKVKIEDEDTYVLSVLGDLNGDGEVNLIDITRVIVSVFFNEPKEDTVQGYEFAADYNKDGTTDMVDLTKMIKTALN